MKGASGIALVGFAIASGPTGSAGEAALVSALILLTIGGVLYLPVQTLERLLDDAPADGSGDTDAQR